MSSPGAVHTQWLVKRSGGEKGFSSIWDISEVYSNFTVSHSLSWDSAVTESQLNFSVCWMLAPSLSSSGSSKTALPRKILWRRHGNPHQYSCLENPMDRGAWRATVHGVAKSWTRLWLTHMHKMNCPIFPTVDYLCKKRMSFVGSLNKY